MSTLTLSLVMIPWDWMGMVTIRSETFLSWSSTGRITRRPGSFVPRILPSRKWTPRSYSVTTLSDMLRRMRATTTSAATTTMVTTMS